jgi:hypothetical protein
VFVAVRSKSNYCRLWWMGKTRGMASDLSNIQQQVLCDKCMLNEGSFYM